MIIGEYEGKITDKNRIAIPKKIRDLLNGGIILSRGYEGCLTLFDQKLWQDLVEVVNTKTILDISVRDTKRFILGGAYELELDAQGRFVLPANLKEYSKLEDEVVFLGLGDWVEVWAKNIWERKLSGLVDNASDIAQTLLNK
jgi:MraZ protein